MNRHSTRRDRRGATLIEVVFASSLLLVVMGSFASISSTGSSLFRSSMVHTEVEGAARRTMEVMTQEILRTGSVVITPVAVSTDSGSSQIDYQCAVGFAGTDIQWGDPSSIRLEIDPGELDDGLDNDGDGLVDERQVVLIRDPGGVAEKRRVLCRGVSEFFSGEIANTADDNGNGVIDEEGLSFHLVGDVMEVRLSLERVDEEGRLVTRTLETSVRLRN